MRHINRHKQRLRRQSAFRIPHSAISLTEVLISMGILTVGLLGVASIFPVGSHFIKQGEIADRGASVAQAAFADLATRGVLQPERWRMWEDGSLDLRNESPSPYDLHNFGRPMALKFRKYAIEENNDQLLLARQFGSAYVIDPIGAATFSVSRGTNVIHYGGNFPATNIKLFVPPSSPWGTWSGRIKYWPIRRITLTQAEPIPGSTGSPTRLIPMRSSLAESTFSSQNDLALELPDSDASPIIQRWELDNNSTPAKPLSRQWKGDYSWIVSVVPSSAAARDALGMDPSAFYYEVSVVVFYKRAVGSVAPASVDEAKENLEFLEGNERLVTAKIVSTGLSGGELLFERIRGPSSASDKIPESPFDELKTGQWIMLSGPHPSSTMEMPIFVMRWYRVLSIEGEDRKLDANGNPYTTTPPSNDPERRLVALRGPVWPWEPATNLTTNDLSNDLRVGIFPGAVAVHSKTMRLEGKSLWSVE